MIKTVFSRVPVSLSKISSTNVVGQRTFATSKLSGKRVIVTGSTSGIGLGIARAFASNGCSILMNGFGDAQEISKLMNEMKSNFKVPVEFHNADMSRGDQVEAMVKYAETKFGSVDILVNNAGIQHVSPIEQFPVEKWDAIIAINLSSVFHAVRAVMPMMRKQKWGMLSANIVTVFFL
jgi:3-hydroxybutyrate dehydrogenase